MLSRLPSPAGAIQNATWHGTGRSDKSNSLQFDSGMHGCETEAELDQERMGVQPARVAEFNPAKSQVRRRHRIGWPNVVSDTRHDRGHHARMRENRTQASHGKN